ncbi:hypothetical protein [Oerskovia turbata]
MTRVELRWIGVGVVLASGVLVGCSPADSDAMGPSDLATPDIRWEGGEPSGPLETDPWVQAVRASELNRALAVNAHDFSDLDLWNSRSPALISLSEHRTGARAVSEPNDPLVALGPLAFEPLRVEVDPSGERATVVVCEYGGTWVTLQDMTVDLEAEWEYSAYEVVTGEDGHLRAGSGQLPQDILDAGRAARSLACEPSQRSIGWFDPAPVVTPFDPEDVVRGAAPVGAEEGPTG